VGELDDDVLLDPLQLQDRVEVQQGERAQHQLLEVPVLCLYLLHEP